MYIAIVVGLGSAGGSRQPLAWQHQMAALALPYANQTASPARNGAPLASQSFTAITPNLFIP